MFAYRKKTREEALREQIKELAKEHYRWGYRFLFNYLRRLGEKNSHTGTNYPLDFAFSSLKNVFYENWYRTD